MTNSRRISLRLPNYDYSQTGAYFITIVTNKRRCMFGSIIDDKMKLSDAGKMIDRVCQELMQFIPNVIMEPYVIMPNHFHAIILLNMANVGATLCGCPGQTRRSAPTVSINNRTNWTSLPDVVARFKSLTTRRFIDGVKKNNWPRFDEHLWQRNYYEHVIRDEIDYELISDYILSNPQNWDKDPEKNQKSS